MTRWLSQVLRIGVLLGIAVILAGCGGGGSAAPSAGGGTPVAVEIPSLDTVAELPFVSGTVVSASGNIAAGLKAAPSSWVYKRFTLEDSAAFTTGDSRLACEYRNMASAMMGTWTLPDQGQCTAQGVIDSVTNPYDGNYHIIATGVSMANIPAKIKFKITRNSSNVITAFEQFIRDATTQISYQLTTISGTTYTSTFKSIGTSEPQRVYVEIRGTLNADEPTEFVTVKNGTMVFAGTNNAGALQGKVNAAQGPDYFYIDGFDSRGDGGNVIRLLGQSSLSNSSSPLTLSDYLFSATGIGAAVMIDNGTLSSGCWDTNNDGTTCSGSNFTATDSNADIPIAVATQTVADFTSSESWDGSGTVEATATFSMGASSCYTRFNLDSSHIDCTTATQGALTVTPTVSSTTLSTNSGSPTSVSTTPTILLTGSRVLDTSSTNSTTTTLVNTSDNSSVSLTYTSWNSDNTILTLSPTLVSGQTYKLTLVGSSTTATRGTVIRSPTADPPNDQLQSTGTYYITAQ